MNLKSTKLAEKIVHHIWQELGALSGLGKIKFNMAHKEKNEIFRKWVEELGDVLKEANSKRKYLGFFDGSSKPNPGEMTIGGYILDPTGKKIYSYTIQLGHGTNNMAEYKSLIHLLRECERRGIERVLIRGDSQLVINQVQGVWQCKDPRMIELCEEAKELRNKISDCMMMWTPRGENSQADRLSKGHGIPSRVKNGG